MTPSVSTDIRREHQFTRKSGKRKIRFNALRENVPVIYGIYLAEGRDVFGKKIEISSVSLKSWK